MDGSNFATALPIVMAASDERYFRKHAVGFAKSALAAGHDVHIVISPKPGPGLPQRARELEVELVAPFLNGFAAPERKRMRVEVVADPRAMADIGGREAIVFYQSLRFFYLPSLLRSYRRPMVVLDIDSLVMKPIPPRIDGDVGLYLRLGNQNGRTAFEREGMQVLGAMVYADPKGASFFDDVVSYLDNHLRLYYIDQHALYHTFLANDDVRIFDIAETGWLDWTFKPGATVWTAKGKKKRRNLVYVRERLRLEGRGVLASALVLTGYALGLIRT
ncbi:hypothetical protein Brsp07_03646 [Brucella sp. NBRC 14130]|uniref:hypothetical protein n=1 Tax=Brucella sp. NBRC 14130 TaxID=3075483 RepID=UPI000E5C557A